MIGGVYIIRNKANGKQYVGSSIDVPRRWTEHQLELEAGRHSNQYLQRAWNKYGPKGFEFTMVKECRPEELLNREQAWMDSVKPFGSRGYNNSRTAGNCLGVKHTRLARERMAQAKRGKPSMFLGRRHTEEAKAKNRVAHLGKKVPPEVVQRIANANRGKKRTEATRERLRQAQLGKRFDDVVKAKMRAAKLGRSWTLIGGTRVWSQKCQH